MSITRRVLARAERALARIGTTPADAALALAVTGLVATELTGDTVASPLLAVPVAVPAVLSLAWRRRAPVTVAGVVCAANLVLSATAPGPFPPQLMALPVLIAVYTVAAYTEGRRSLLGAAVTLPLIVVAHIMTGDGDPDDFLPWLLWGAPWVLGKVVRRRTTQASRVAVEATLLAQRREQEAREAVAAERDRIARDLHDVVAHAVSLMVVQAGAERLALHDTAPRTRTALEAIETAGRNALGELRTMLSVLRPPEDTTAELAPHPDLGELPALVERVRHAGVAVELTIELAGPVPPGVAVSAYRIVQEALTNVLKHAPPSAVVRVAGHLDSLRVEVRNPLTGGRPAPAGNGRGLVGMRERAAVHGGDVTAGEEQGAWVVRARLPFAPAPVGAA
ncbi:MAG: sensor histidine kinase [Micromonosporaceae bacterium]